jgi:hypothetical protein
MADDTNAVLRAAWRAEAVSEAEIAWFFTAANGKVPEEGEVAPVLRDAAAVIRAWLDAIPTFHVGALALRFAPRVWSRCIRKEFGSWTSLVVRLECAKHPSEKRRSVDELEAEAVCRLERAIEQGRGRSERVRLRKHAEQHVRAAIRAYAKARGTGECVVPAEARVVL